MWWSNEKLLVCIFYRVRNKWLQVNARFSKAVNNIKAHVGNITGISYGCFHELKLYGTAFSLQRVNIAINSERAAQLTYPGRWTLSCWTTFCCSPGGKAEVLAPTETSGIRLPFLLLLHKHTPPIRVSIWCHRFLANLFRAVNFPNYIQIQLFSSVCEPRILSFHKSLQTE